MTSVKKRWVGLGALIQLALVIVAAVILIELVGLVLGQRVNSLQTRVPGSDKVLHFCGFAALSLAISELLRRTSPGLPSPAPVERINDIESTQIHAQRRHWGRSEGTARFTTRSSIPLVVSLLLALVAVADEAGQAFNPHRNVDVGDLVAGWCGLAAAGCWRLRRQRPAVAVAIGVTALAIAASVTLTSITRQRHLNAAVRFERVGDFVGARREYLAALSAGEQGAHLYNQLGWVEIESGIGDPSMAVRYSERALAMRPDDPDISDTYGWALHHVGRNVEALSYLDRAYAGRPDMFCIHYHLGKVLVALGQIDKAKFHFQQQMELVNTNEAARARTALEELQKP